MPADHRDTLSTHTRQATWHTPTTLPLMFTRTIKGDTRSNVKVFTNPRTLTNAIL